MSLVSWSRLCHTALLFFLLRFIELNTNNCVMDDAALFTSSLLSVWFSILVPPRIICTKATREEGFLSYCSSSKDPWNLYCVWNLFLDYFSSSHEDNSFAIMISLCCLQQSASSTRLEREYNFIIAFMSFQIRDLCKNCFFKACCIYPLRNISSKLFKTRLVQLYYVRELDDALGLSDFFNV